MLKHQGQPRILAKLWRPLVQSLGLVAAATLLGTVAQLFLSPTNVAMIYLIAVVIAAVSIGRGAAVLVSFLGVLAFDFFFVPPRLTFAVEDTQYLLTFASLAAVGLVIGYFVSRVREQAEAAQRREVEASTLYALSRDLAVTTELPAMMHIVAKHVSAVFGGDVVIYLPDSEREEKLTPRLQSPRFPIDRDETEAAIQAFEQGRTSGRGTDTMPEARGYYLPLRTTKGVTGVLGIDLADHWKALTPRHIKLMEAFVSIAALAIERGQFAETAREAQLLRATEKLQTALLNSISHDLRTPLVSITGALSSLQDKYIVEDASTRESLVSGALEEAERLNRLVGNLLDMTRIEAGTMQMAKQMTSVQEVVGSVLEQMNERLKDRRLELDLPESLPAIPMDPVLIGQVLTNILDNAVKYSEAGLPLGIRAYVSGAYLQIEVADRGVGIPARDLPHIFDKFYRVRRPEKVPGTGLGLSICKGLVEAHGGYIEARNRPGGGAVLVFGLPLSAPASTGNAEQRQQKS